MTLISVQDFYITVSMADLVTWFGEDEESFSGNEFLQISLQSLGLNVDLKMLYLRYFDEISVGTGDVYIYAPAKHGKVFFALNLYRGLTDQMDVISLGFCCTKDDVKIVRESLRSFFDMASCQVHYEESSYSVGLRNMIDANMYPLIIDESGYQQKIFHIYG